MRGRDASVSAMESYLLRAIPQSDDEVGKLECSLNQVLKRIQERDIELQKVNEELKLRVQARARELQPESLIHSARQV